MRDENQIHYDAAGAYRKVSVPPVKPMGDYIPFEPLFPRFNDVVRKMARFIPYKLANEAYVDFEAMKADAAANGGWFKVNIDHSAYTIFEQPSVNWAFRAWHDSCHLAADADFSEAGEREAMWRMVDQLIDAYGSTPLTLFWVEVIYIEVMGQFYHLQEFGVFPEDQRQFMLDRLEQTGWDRNEAHYADF